MKQVPRVFIGSSTESLQIAQLVKKELNGEFDCVIWNENFFELNEDTYRNLVKNSIGFDFAIFVGGKDDLTKRNNGRMKKSQNKIRDNVYLEFGLYAGILSPERTFFLVDNECQIASDLNGITLCFYSSEDEIKYDCKNIINRMRTERSLSRAQWLPSTSLAYGYFHNFLKKTAEKVDALDKLKIDGKDIDVQNFKKTIEVAIPQDVTTDWANWASWFYNKRRHVKNETIEGNVRLASVYIDYDLLKTNCEVRLIDVPQTLRSSFGAVDMVLENGYIGHTENAIRARQREVLNFVRTLKLLAKEDVYVQNTLVINEYDGKGNRVGDDKRVYL